MTDSRPTRAELASTLSAAGCVAADEEADELLAACGDDPARLAALVERRRAGEPLAWLTGTVQFAETTLRVEPGVYVPRWQSNELARLAIAALPERGSAADVCTGSGALAAAINAARPDARVVATDRSSTAVDNARANGVEAFCGDLFSPLPEALRHTLDVVVAVAPYVPTPELALLPRDTLAYEDAALYDGGPDGLDVIRRIVDESPRWLRPGGTLLLELGGNQSTALAPDLERAGFGPVETWTDEDGDLRGLRAELVDAPG